MAGWCEWWLDACRLPKMARVKESLGLFLGRCDFSYPSTKVEACHVAVVVLACEYIFCDLNLLLRIPPWPHQAVVGRLASMVMHRAVTERDGERERERERERVCVCISVPSALAVGVFFS